MKHQLEQVGVKFTKWLTTNAVRLRVIFSKFLDKSMPRAGLKVNITKIDA